jgi:hypothetical protein
MDIIEIREGGEKENMIRKQKGQWKNPERHKPRGF